MADTGAAPPSPLFTRERLTALIVATALFMETMDSTVIATALPAIAGDLGTEPLTLRLAVTAYLLSLAVAIPASGWIADRFGARNVFRAAIGVFMLGSIGCAVSDSLTTFVLARIVQGAGGAMMTPIGRLILVRTVSKRDLVNAMAWLTIPALIGPIAGPPLGGFITTFASWHWIFIINIPIGIAGILLATRYFEDIRTEERHPFDLRGWLLAGLGLAGLAFGFSVIGLPFMPHWVLATLLIGGTVFTTAYVIHARHHPRPVLDFTLLRRATFHANIVGGGFFRTGVGALPFLMPLMLQLGFHLTPFQSGLITFSTALGAMQMKVVVPAVLRRFGFRTTLLWNAWICAAMLASCALFTPATPYAVMVGALIVNGFFRSLQFSAVNALAYAELAPAEISRATPMLAVAQQLSATAGVAVGAIAVDIMIHLNGHTSAQAEDFGPAFILVGLISLMSAWVFWRLPENAGEELANRLPTPTEDQRAG